jgi:hypothetical protein
MNNVEIVTPVVKVKRKYTKKVGSKPMGRPKKATVAAGEGVHSHDPIKAILGLPLPDAVVLRILRAYTKL